MQSWAAYFFVVVVGELPTHISFNRPVSVLQSLRCLCCLVRKIYVYSLGV